MKNAQFDFQPIGFTPFKRRTLAYGQRVKVYRNLHKKCYSVCDAETGLVLGYVEAITLKGARFVVHEAGRQRVLREKQKNVHAYVIGNFATAGTMPQMHRAFYNPYRAANFMTERGAILLAAASVSLDDDGIRYTFSNV